MITKYKDLWYDWMGGNEVIFYAINGIRGNYYDQVMRGISWLGKHEHFPYYVAGLIVFVFLHVLYKLIKRNRGIKQYLLGWFGVFCMLGVGFGCNAVVTYGLKEQFAFPRPYVALAKERTPVNRLENVDPDKAYRSFPSGHVMFTVLMVVALWPVFYNMFAWAGMILIALMMWSRVSLGVHFPADVIGSLMIALPLFITLQAFLYAALRVIKIRC